MHEREVRRAAWYGIRQSFLEGESETLSGAVDYLDSVIVRPEESSGVYKDDLLARVHDIKTDMLAARCEVEEELALYQRRDTRALKAEYEASAM